MNGVRSRGAWLLMGALAIGCNQDLPGLGGGLPPGPAVSSEQLLSLRAVARFDITLDAEAIADLEQAPKEWTRGRFEHADTRLENVAVRLKGNHTLRTLDEKPSFKLEFDEYVPRQRFLGLEGLTLNNMIVDDSMLREWIGFRVFRELDVPAPRTGYAEVFVNDEPFGLYLVLEPYDDEFLARVYEDPRGNLYESELSADIDGNVEEWDQDEGEDESREDLLVLKELAMRDDDAVFYGSEAVIDLPRFLAFMAGETIVGHFDGHVGGHNFFIYHELASGQWTYLPWSLDQTLARRVTPWEHNGYLGHKCLHYQGCLVDYVLASQEAVERIAALDLAAEIEQAIELTDAAAHADPRKTVDDDALDINRARARDYILARPGELVPELDCLVGGNEPDADGDGYGPCFQDCDETDPQIHAGATEACDGIDNDCSGFIDDSPACECPSVVSGGRTFYLCHNRITWFEARTYCADQGRELARFDSLEQTAVVWAAAAEIDGGRWAIGLNDRALEEDYRWIDGTAPGFTAWASGEPSHQLEWFDCVFLRGGAWSECNCIEEGSFICTDED